MSSRKTGCKGPTLGAVKGQLGDQHTGLGARCASLNHPWFSAWLVNLR